MNKLSKKLFAIVVSLILLCSIPASASAATSDNCNVVPIKGASHTVVTYTYHDYSSYVTLPDGTTELVPMVCTIRNTYEQYTITYVCTTHTRVVSTETVTKFIGQNHLNCPI